MKQLKLGIKYYDIVFYSQTILYDIKNKILIIRSYTIGDRIGT